jgi:ribosome-binding protein aMBF1 (putative translation factor)
MKPCSVCGETYPEASLEPSPSGSHVMVCASCAEDIRADMYAMRQAADDIYDYR